MDVTVYLEPGSLLLVPVLNLIGYWIKNTGKIKSSLIPIILSVTGITLCLFRAFGEQEYGNVYEYVFSSVTQGVLAAAAAVYSNQIYKQIKGGKTSDDSDREI